MGTAAKQANQQTNTNTQTYKKQFAILLVASLAVNACVAKRQTYEELMKQEIDWMKRSYKWESCTRTEGFGGYYECRGGRYKEWIDEAEEKLKGIEERDGKLCALMFYGKELRSRCITTFRRRKDNFIKDIQERERKYGKCWNIDYINLRARCPNGEDGTEFVWARRSASETKTVNVRGRRSGKLSADRNATQE